MRASVAIILCRCSKIGGLKLTSLHPFADHAVPFKSLELHVMDIQAEQYNLSAKMKSPGQLSTRTLPWSREEVDELFRLPFADLLYRAQQVHREYFDANAIQLSTLLSIN